MMKNARRMTCFALGVFFVLTAFVPVSNAQMRHFVGSGKLGNNNNAQNSIVQDEEVASGFTVIKASNLSNVSIGSLFITNDVDNGSVPEDAIEGFYAAEEWVDRDLIKRGAPACSFRSVTLAISSNSSKCIELYACANTAASVQSIGVSQVQLQRYYNGKWVTIYSVSSDLAYNASRFVFSRCKTSIVSHSYYRVSVTFVAKNGNLKTTMTKTTSGIKCR